MLPPRDLSILKQEPTINHSLVKMLSIYFKTIFFTGDQSWDFNYGASLILQYINKFYMHRKRIQFSEFEFEELEVKNLSYKCREIGGGCGREMVIRSEYNSVSRHLVSPPCLPITYYTL